MNNDAFRKLVNEGGLLGKSTKQIAVEAVENEFKFRRRKGKNNTYLSDDESQDSGSKRKRKRDLLPEATSNLVTTKNNKKLNAPQYRDRAKERREGKAPDYEGLYNTEHVDDEMSKYLGGDESYTHLVKGLDSALAEKVRRSEDKGLDLQQKYVDLDELMDEAVSMKSKSINSTNVLVSNTLDEIQFDSKSSFLSGMVSYLNGFTAKNVQNSNFSTISHSMSLQGQRVARTTLKFSTRANIGDRMRSWELPQEIISSSEEYDKIAKNVSRIRVATPLDDNLITKLKSVFASSTKDLDHKNVAVKKAVAQDSDEDIFSD